MVPPNVAEIRPSSNLLPFRQTKKALGPKCDTAWGVLQSVKDYLGKKAQIIFLLLDQNRRPVDTFIVPYRPLRANELVALAKMAKKDRGEIICVFCKDLQIELKMRPHEILEKHSEEWDNIFHSSDYKGQPLYISESFRVSGEMIFSTKRGEWFSFLPYPKLTTRPMEAEIKTSGVRKLRTMAENDLEERFLQTFRGLSPMERSTIILHLEVQADLHKKHQETILAAMNGRLTDGQAKTWAWLRDKVIAGEFCPRG